MKTQEDNKPPCNCCTIFLVIKKKKIIISFNRPVLLCREQAKGKKA